MSAVAGPPIRTKTPTPATTSVITAPAENRNSHPVATLVTMVSAKSNRSLGYFRRRAKPWDHCLRSFSGRAGLFALNQEGALHKAICLEAFDEPSTSHTYFPDFETPKGLTCNPNQLLQGGVG